MTINFSDLFTRIGKCCHIADLIVTAQASTIPTDVEAFLTLMDAETDELMEQAIVKGLDTSIDNAKGYGSSELSALVATTIQRLVINMVKSDVPLRNPTLDNCLTELIAQMDDNAETVDASTVSITTDYGTVGSSSSGTTGDNTGSGLLVWCTKRGDGHVNEFILGESLTCKITAANANGTATWQIEGQASKSLLSVDWPAGSAVLKSVTSHIASSGNLVPYGDFETEDDNEPNLPSTWIGPIATYGTTVKMTDVEIQTVTINGTPTGGHYVLHWTDRDGITYSTVTLDHDATSSEVQSALRDLPQLDEVEVASSGTSPNLTHSVTFYNVPNPGQMTYTSLLTGGTPTITIATPTPGSAYIARGARCLQLVGDGAELTTLQVPVSVDAATCYGLCIWLATDDAPATGVMVVDLVDGIGGTQILDDQGTANAITIDLTALIVSHTGFPAMFHTPTVLPAEVYLRIRLTTAIENAKNVFVDELAMVEATELYAGGPFVSAFTGPIDFVTTDKATVTITAGREGECHEWMNRCLGLAGKRLLLPTEPAPSTNPDATIIV